MNKQKLSDTDSWGIQQMCIYLYMNTYTLTLNESLLFIYFLFIFSFYFFNNKTVDKRWNKIKKTSVGLP